MGREDVGFDREEISILEGGEDGTHIIHDAVGDTRSQLGVYSL